MTRTIAAFAASCSLLAACASPDGAATGDGTTGSSHEAGAHPDETGATRPAGSADMMTVEGRISDGVECPIVTTPDGLVYSLSPGDHAYSGGVYVRIEGEQADASICMQGEGHLIVDSIDVIDPPARDRDPARAGGVRITGDYVQGAWAPQGGDCRNPAFRIDRNSNGGSIIHTRVNGKDETGYAGVGRMPAFHFDAPLPALPIESRGPDGIAVLVPESGPLTLGGTRIEGDGVVFVKCAADFVG